MAGVPEIDGVDQEVQLTFGSSSLVCAGTLSAQTRPYVLEAARELLADRPPCLTIDVSDVRIVDVDGANTFAHLQRLARQEGTTLHWQGLDSDRLRGILPLRVPRRRPRPSPTCLRLYGGPPPAAQQLPSA